MENIYDIPDFGCICVSVGKEQFTRDLIIMPKDGKTISVRSCTELINKLKTFGISYDELKKIIDFVSITLIELNKDNYDTIIS